MRLRFLSTSLKAGIFETWKQLYVTRGSVGLLATGDYGTCLNSGITGDFYAADAPPPPAGQGYVYLVQGYSSVCGLGTLGFGSSETERANPNPGACTE